MKVLNRFWKDIKQGENIDLYVTIMVALILALLNLSGLASQALIPPITLAVLALLAVNLVGNRHQIADTLETMREYTPSAITRFYSSRRELIGFEEEVNCAKKEIFIVGNAMGWLFGGYKDALTAQILEGCNVKLLLLNPIIDGKPNPLLKLFKEITCTERYESMAYLTIDILKAWHKQIAIENPDAASRLQIRYYSTLVTLVIMFTDPDSSSGKMRVELLPHRFEGRQRPSFDIQPEKGGELYSLMLGRYRELWNTSTPLSEIKIPDNNSVNLLETNGQDRLTSD
jgi:hypothetical protein